MLYRIRKLAVSFANVYMLYLMFQLVTGRLDWGVAAGSLLLGAFWLGITAFSLRELMTTYYDLMSRWRIRLPLIFGVALAVVAFIANDSYVLRGIALAEGVAWAAIFWGWRRNRDNFVRTGHGLLPAGAWLNPPVAVINPGDLILTSGRMAERMDQAVGHGEVAIVGPDGKLKLLSSYMLKGTVINDAEKLLRIMVKRGEHYVVLRLRKPLTEDQKKRGYAIAEGMLGENIAWREEADAKRKKLIAKLWLPASWKAKLTEKTEFATTGYSWMGLFIGTKHRDRWTCIGACAEWYDRLRVKMRHYGTGLLGIGTGILDPIQPQRFLTDPALELLNEQHKAEYERTQPQGN